MKTKPVEKKINIITLGCAKNLFDSEIIINQLKNNDFDVHHNANLDQAPIVIINTCGFIGPAKEESVQTILQCTAAKKEGIIKKVYVAGCLSHRYKEDLKKEIPEVDAYFGTSDFQRILKTLKADYKKELVGERILTTPGHYAYLKISEGCDRPCSFCAIPLMRGKHKSFPIEHLVKQAQTLANQGVKELLIIAQDSTYYGLDLYGERKLAELLKQLSKVDGIEWIRLHYAYPGGFPLDVLDVINESPKICKYIDIPLQHISDSILKSMRRGTTKKRTYELLETIKKRIPGIAIRTTLITGYPGETDHDFEELLSFVKEIEFDRLGVFTYSHEEGTHAFSLKDDVPEKVKSERCNIIMETQQNISLKKNKSLIDHTINVMIDLIEKDHIIGRTEKDSPEIDNEVIFSYKQKNSNLKPGMIVPVRITDAEPYDLFGILQC
ncbi:MAG: ribosomal protein S12 methylthiotransferase RimO [Vicingaceae bacterium]|nr:MAG: ribosomal protein S12 methylthiotransferase RimO [Vicingaceae bacterium]